MAGAAGSRRHLVSVSATHADTVTASELCAGRSIGRDRFAE